jgi:hypothetical protein
MTAPVAPRAGRLPGSLRIVLVDAAQVTFLRAADHLGERMGEDARHGCHASFDAWLPPSLDNDTAPIDK